MKIYISGPMSGVKDNNRLAFNSAAKKLRGWGYVVVNPIELNKSDASWSECMRNDIRALCDCDMLVTLPDWHRSEGAKEEVRLAEIVFKMPVMDYWQFKKEGGELLSENSE